MLKQSTLHILKLGRMAFASLVNSAGAFPQAEAMQILGSQERQEAISIRRLKEKSLGAKPSLRSPRRPSGPLGRITCKRLGWRCQLCQEREMERETASNIVTIHA